jgi:hypothetical protein
MRATILSSRAACWPALTYIIIQILQILPHVITQELAVLLRKK